MSDPEIELLHTFFTPVHHDFTASLYLHAMVMRLFGEGNIMGDLIYLALLGLVFWLLGRYVTAADRL